MTGWNVLEVTDLAVRFGHIESVRGISFKLRAGQRVGLVGESGSGKSVTALSMMRLTDRAQTSGSILLNGADVLRVSPRRMRSIRGSKIAMVYQDPMSSLSIRCTPSGARSPRRSRCTRRSADATRGTARWSC